MASESCIVRIGIHNISIVEYSRFPYRCRWVLYISTNVHDMKSEFHIKIRRKSYRNGVRSHAEAHMLRKSKLVLNIGNEYLRNMSKKMSSSMPYIVF